MMTNESNNSRAGNLRDNRETHQETHTKKKQLQGTHTGWLFWVAAVILGAVVAFHYFWRVPPSGTGDGHGATGTFEEYLDSLPDYDYIAEIRELESEGRLEEAEHLADFVLKGSSITNRDEVAALRAEINKKRTAFWNRAYRAGKGFVVGDGVSLEELSGAIVSDFLLWGDIRDLAKQGYYKAIGKETDPVIAALASVGVLTSLASFWVADPAEPAEVAADASLSCLKTLRKMGHLSKQFCGVLVEACQKTVKAKSASKGLKEIVVGMKGLFDGAGAARASVIMKHIDDIDSLKAVSTMAKRMPEPTAILVRTYGKACVKVLGKLAGAENGAMVLGKAARKGPKALGKILSYAKYGARMGKTFWLGHPQRLCAAFVKVLGRVKCAVITFLIVAFGLWKIKMWRVTGILRRVVNRLLGIVKIFFRCVLALD